MEYKIFHYLRHHLVLPYILRVFIGVFFIIFSFAPIILPIFPGSFFLGLGILVAGFLLFISGKKIRHVIKLRKGIIHLFKNIHKKHIITQKIRDIRTHIKDILNNKKS